MRSQQEIEAKLREYQKRHDQAQAERKEALRKGGHRQDQDIETDALLLDTLRERIWALKWVLGLMNES